MKPSHLPGNKRRHFVLIQMALLVLAACSLQSIVAPPRLDLQPTSTPTLAPVATTVFAFLDPVALPEYLEPEPGELDPYPEPPECDREWVVDEVLADPETSPREVKIECNLILEPYDVVGRRLIIETPGITVDCNDAMVTGGTDPNGRNYNADMIQVRSTSQLIDTEDGQERVWSRPWNVTIRDCNVIGSVRIWGMGRNGQGTNPLIESENPYRVSSRQEGHTERARAAAPTRIVLDNLIITGVGKNPVYFAPGVTYSQLINSELYGRSNHVAIYLDAESYGNTIKNNTITVDTGTNFIGQGRPLIAIDGSSHNRIMNNWFSNLSHGGIYLYRNCGEGGVIRHETPSYNQIINNTFFYVNYSGSNPAVFMGSRNYGHLFDTLTSPWSWLVPVPVPLLGVTTVPLGLVGEISRVLSDCNDEDGYDFGSSDSDNDHATHNVVMQNQIFVRSVDDMIRTGDSNTDAPNYVDYNRTVTYDSVELNRLAGCYVADGFTDFVTHGSVIDAYPDPNNRPVCTDYQDTCNDGELIRTASTGCQLTTQEFGCSVTSDNDGCSTATVCPFGGEIVAVTAACNLEWGDVPDDIFASVPGNTIEVIRPSDAVSSGLCWVEDSAIREGQQAIDDLWGYRGVYAGCDEYDQNGGDCEIRGVLYCR